MIVANQSGKKTSDLAGFYGQTWSHPAPAGSLQAQVEQLRKTALARFEQVGFPDTTLEEWRFTNVQPIAKTRFKPAPASPEAGKLVELFGFGRQATAEIVFVNGHFVPGLSRISGLPRGLTVCSLSEAMQNQADLVGPHLGRLADLSASPLIALNTGLLHDGAFVHVRRGAAIDGAINLLYLSTAGQDPTATHPRSLIVMEDNAQAQVVETYAGRSGVYWTNAVTEIALGSDAALDHCKLQQESLQAFHTAAMQVKLARNARFVSHAVTLGGKLTRNDLNCVLDGEHADATLNGLVLIGGGQHCDNHTLLRHNAPHCPSHELYKHVLDGDATGVFKGQIYVAPGAQKTDAKQTSKTLLLSREAQINSMPALEIYADDVKCTHGSTIGPVDEDMTFYLCTRGVSRSAARHLLTYAFAADITRRMRVEPVRRRVEDFMAARHDLPRDLRITAQAEHDADVVG